MTFFSLATFPITSKKVFLRVDYNIFLSKREPKDNYKIKQTIPTINFLLQKNCKIILATHLGRPNGKRVPELTTKKLIPILKKTFPRVPINALSDCIGKDVTSAILKGKQKSLFLLENLRFYKEEKENNNYFARELATLADVYVNDAFGTLHRAHASVEAITHFLPSIPGFLVQHEVNELARALEKSRQSIWIIGGAKIDKVDFFHTALQKAKYILVGGALAFPFLRAKGIPIGMSRIDAASINSAKKILKHKNASKIILPVDFHVAEKMTPNTPSLYVDYNQIQPHQIGLDLGPKTIARFKQYLRQADTIVWNGTLGYAEWAKFATATKEIGRFLGTLTATTIVGGGETSEAMHTFHLADKLTHVSTGGGAALDFLAGKKLPGLTALHNNYQHYKKKIHSQKSVI